MKYTRLWVTVLALLITLSILTVVWKELYIALQEAIRASGEWGIVLFIGVMFLATVFAPLSALPLVPVLAPIFGPFATSVASIIGWTLGASAAFCIARYGGQPFIGRFIDVRSLMSIEAQIPKTAHFMLLVMLRMIIPVDVLSYALGLFSAVRFPEYFFTTLLGVSWFSFAFAYMGNALFSHDYVLLGILGVASASVLLIAVTYVRRAQKKEDE